MEPLPPPYSHFLSAAIGWLELGCPAEALAELNSLPEALRCHPDVLEAYWLTHGASEHWQAGLEVASKLVEIAPERSSGWLHRAYALRRVKSGGIKKAMEALLPAFTKFPEEPVIPYNLACYACQLDQLPEARSWLNRAIAVGGKERMTAMALADSDLEPLWSELQQSRT